MGEILVGSMSFLSPGPPFGVDFEVSPIWGENGEEEEGLTRIIHLPSHIPPH